ncbi:MAG: hypothetical protein WD825_08045 [Gemmatimonadaceae bacterium]
MTERRFNEAEVAAIFERATEAQQTGQRQLPSGEGMTLAQLQEIGRVTAATLIAAALGINDPESTASMAFRGHGRRDVRHRCASAAEMGAAPAPADGGDSRTAHGPEAMRT